MRTYKGVCFADENGLLEAIRERCPAAILLDVKLPQRLGIEIQKDLAAYPVPVIMISGHGDIRTAVTAMKDGACDFIQKPFTGRDILNHLGEVTARFPRHSSTVQQNLSTFSFPGREPLTLREREVLQAVAVGSSNKEIGAMLKIRFRTVEDHRYKILHKLGVKNIAELLLAVLR